MFWSKHKAKEKENLVLKFAGGAAFFVMIVCNLLANTLPINGNTTAEVSDSYPNLIAPIGFTFAIWGVIYLLLGLFCVFQFRRLRGAETKVSENLLSTIAPYFIASSLLNSVWIFAWHYRLIGLSTLLIIAILVCLVIIARTLVRQSYTTKDYLLVRLPFSIYFGWVSVAVIANITTWLVSLGWDGGGFAESFWAIVVLVIGALVAIVQTDTHKDVAYLAVFIWAYFGILSKHLAESGFGGLYDNVIAVLVVLLAVFVYRSYRLIATKTPKKV